MVISCQILSFSRTKRVLTAVSDEKDSAVRSPGGAVLGFLFSSDPAVSSSIFVGENGEDLIDIVLFDS